MRFCITYILIVSVVITSGPQSSTVAEQDATTGSPVLDTTPTSPAGTLAFTDDRDLTPGLTTWVRLRKTFGH